MSYARYPAERLNATTRSAVEICTSIGLVVKSVTKIPRGLLAYHTITSADGTITYMDEGYNSDIRTFANGIMAAQVSVTMAHAVIASEDTPAKPRKTKR